MAVSHWAEVIESNVSAANNTSTVTLRVHLVTSGESYNYNEQLGNTYIYTPGENKFWRRYTLPPDTDTKIDSVIEGVAHNNDGSKTITWSYSLPTGISAGTVTGSGSATLTKIPRQTSITNFTVSKINETSLKFNWATADTVDYIQYSTNNGSSWTGIDVTDGKSGNFNVTGLSPGTSYNCKIKVRRKDSQLYTTSSTVVQSTYAAPTISLYARTETTVTVKWGLDTTASHLWYSINNGSSWVDVGAVSTKVGDITISGLTANTSYNIKVKLRRASSNTDYSSATLTVATFNYPNITAVGTSALTIGNSQKLTIYNPLSRNTTIRMYQNSTSGTQLYSGTTTGTSITFTPVANTLYASIPNAQTGTCVYSAIYGSSTKTTGQHTYKVKGTETPTFTNFTFADTNFASLTGNNQVLVQGLSNLRVTIPSANKMVAKNSASGNKYTVSCDTRNGNVNYSADSDVYVNLGTITTSGSKAISVSAYDSRNLYTTVIKNVTVIPYAKPTIVSTATRLNNFENQTTLKVNGVFSKVTVDEVDKNTITNVKYRVREVGGEWGSLTAITFTTNDNKYTCSNVTLDLDNTKSFEIQVQTTDTMNQTTTTTVTVNVGKAAFFIKKAGGFESNGASKITGTTEINGNTVVSGAHYLRVNGSAASQPLRTRGIVGTTADGTAIDNLYVQFGANKPTYFGNTAAYNISADGGTYSGKASTAGTADTANKIKSNSTNPTSATNYYFTFVSENANSVDLRANNGAYYTTREGTTSQVGQGILRLGNTTARGTAANKRGYLRICGETAYYSQLQTADGISANRTIYMPNHNGTIQVRPTNLYNNGTGTTGTVTLSQTAANFNYLDIYWSNVDDGYIQHSRVAAPNNKTFQASSSSYNSSQAKVWFTVKRYKISGTSITIATNNIVTAIKGNGISDAPQSYDAIRILRVDGWL